MCILLTGVVVLELIENFSWKIYGFRNRDYIDFGTTKNNNNNNPIFVDKHQQFKKTHIHTKLVVEEAEGEDEAKKQTQQKVTIVSKYSRFWWQSVRQCDTFYLDGKKRFLFPLALFLLQILPDYRRLWGTAVYSSFNADHHWIRRLCVCVPGFIEALTV